MEKKAKGFGIAGLALGILSIYIGWFVGMVGILMATAGIIFSVKQKNISPNGIATGGLVTSIIGLVFSAIAFLIWILF